MHSARRHMVLDICMTYHEDTLKGFKVIERTRFCHRNCYLQSSVLVNIYMKFHVDIFNGFQVIERTRLCDRRTDGQTDRRPGEKICLPILKGEDIIKWAASSEFGTYRLCEQRRFRRACASAQSRQNLRCSLIQAVSQEEPSDRKPDPWPL